MIHERSRVPVRIQIPRLICGGLIGLGILCVSASPALAQGNAERADDDGLKTNGIETNSDLETKRRLPATVADPQVDKDQVKLPIDRDVEPDTTPEVDFNIQLSGFPELKHPKDNPPSKAKIALGKQLYWDKRLSSDNTISCATCHDPAHGWASPEMVGVGVGGAKGKRNSPTIINTVYNTFHFWDGRAGSLEEQALGPIQNPIEMNMKMDDALERLNNIPGYRRQFKEVFGSEIITEEKLARAIAAYERTIVSGDAPYDKFVAGDKDALSEAADRGRKLFFGQAGCSSCHSGPNFTDDAFHNIGVGMDKDGPDPGRFAVTNLEGDTGSFKTPTLREIARTAPYMHDGSLKTLEDVVRYYNTGGIANPYLDEEMFELGLTDQQVKDIAIFMREGLASPNYPNHKAPTLPE